MYENKKEPNYLLATFIVIEIIYCIIIGSIIPHLFVSDNISTDFTAQPSASINGLPPFISDIDSKTIGNSLYALMLQNTRDKTLLNQNATATVNNDSTFHFDSQGFTFFSATLDAPSLDQSYKLLYSYPDEGNNSFQSFTEIVCIKAPVTSCTSSSSITEYDIAHDFLPKVDFDQFSVYLTEDDPQKINITPVLSTNIDETTKTSYIEEVKSTLRALSLSPDSFTYYIVTPNDFTYNIND